MKIKEFVSKSHIMFIFVSALILNIVIEILSRINPLEVFGHIISHPIFFMYNVTLISLTLSISLFFKRKKFVMAIISLFWIALGVANFIVLSYRVTPFAAIDFYIMEWDFEFMQSYLSAPVVGAIILFFGITIFTIMTVFKKCQKTEINVRHSVATVLSLFTLVAGLYYAFLITGIAEPRISNMEKSYDKFGFVSCFTRSAIERGIDKPDDYCEDMIANMMNKIDTETNTPKETPNVIVVQLESFFDPNLLIGTEFSENPIPTFTKLSDENSSGMLNVATVGAGTANTEFEILTGMSVGYFGTGEYPYETILMEKTCESMAYNLKELGYNTFAMHNNTGTFYNRNEVYPNLGFDKFISSEFMTDTETTMTGWIKDKCLTGEIKKCFDSTENQDFVFAVSVQGHGSYPKEKIEDLKIKVTESPFEESLQNQLEYYVNQINEMDEFVKELTEYIDSLDEPTVLALYGDHIPPLEIATEYLETKNNYQTPYVFYSNFDMEEIDRDLYTYQMGSALLGQVGINNGEITKVHQEISDEEDYLEVLKTMQYDILYGDNYTSNCVSNKKTYMTMGFGNVGYEIDVDDRYVYLSSDDFTEDSFVFVNDDKVESDLKGQSLVFDRDEVEKGDTLQVKYISPSNTVLYQTNEYRIN